jgi:hypothetical protein
LLADLPDADGRVDDGQLRNARSVSLGRHWGLADSSAPLNRPTCGRQTRRQIEDLKLDRRFRRRQRRFAQPVGTIGIVLGGLSVDAPGVQRRVGAQTVTTFVGKP